MYYNNDINKKIDELTKIVLNEFKMDELKIRVNIRESLNIEKTFSDSTPLNKKISNNISNDNYVNNNKNKDKNALNNKKKGNNKINKLRSKTFKFDNFNEFLKKEEEKKKEKEEILKQNTVFQEIEPPFLEKKETLINSKVKIFKE